jgi:hypothetical protein
MRMHLAGPRPRLTLQYSINNTPDTSPPNLLIKPQIGDHQNSDPQQLTKSPPVGSVDERCRHFDQFGMPPSHRATFEPTALLGPGLNGNWVVMPHVIRSRPFRHAPAAAVIAGPSR